MAGKLCPLHGITKQHGYWQHLLLLVFTKNALPVTWILTGLVLEDLMLWKLYLIAKSLFETWLWQWIGLCNLITFGYSLNCKSTWKYSDDNHYKYLFNNLVVIKINMMTNLFWQEAIITTNMQETWSLIKLNITCVSHHNLTSVYRSVICNQGLVLTQFNHPGKQKQPQKKTIFVNSHFHVCKRIVIKTQIIIFLYNIFH